MLKEQTIRMEEETAILVLVPFGHQPVIAFENIKLGHGAIRKLAIQNPSSKQIQVCIHNISTRTQRQLSIENRLDKNNMHLPSCKLGFSGKTTKERKGV